jgi:hypothetical protein
MRLVSEAAKAAERAAKEAEAKAKKEAEEANVSNALVVRNPSRKERSLILLLT